MSTPHFVEPMILGSNIKADGTTEEMTFTVADGYRLTDSSGAEKWLTEEEAKNWHKAATNPAAEMP